MDHGPAIPHGSSRLNEKFFQLARTLFVTPVSNPHNVDVLGKIKRLEIADVRCFVERPGPRHAKAISVNAPYGFSKRQHSVQKMKIEFKDFSRACVRAMMAVM